MPALYGQDRGTGDRLAGYSDRPLDIPWYKVLVKYVAFFGGWWLFVMFLIFILGPVVLIGLAKIKNLLDFFLVL